MKSITKEDKALENAPLEILFANNATAKILDSNNISRMGLFNIRYSKIFWSICKEY
ncbi:MAG: hypothetical protein KatS3mg003_0886 [Candidatus Nitrosocaldaceae archaeon]|nr:MAG: hypothetical protein KatS3mg003_0886 [Candidatus Nitrosocaldaceae archaeon]